MGITDFSLTLLERVIKEYHPKTVLELGDQILYTADNRYGKYADIFYKERGIDYDCIDLNGNNGAEEADMSYPYMLENGSGKIGECYDLITDFGFSEHIGRDGAFSWEGIYNCWLNKFNLCKTGGVIVTETPKTKNWIGHGFNYVDFDFYWSLSRKSGLYIGQNCIGEHPAMGNTTDGWNIWCIMKKVENEFPSLENFKTLPLKQS
jgi:hypothetical protein